MVDVNPDVACVSWCCVPQEPMRLYDQNQTVTDQIRKDPRSGQW